MTSDIAQPYLAANLQLRRRGNVPALPTIEGVVQNVAEQAIKVGWTQAAEEGCIAEGLAGAPVIAWAGEAGRVKTVLTLMSTEARRAQAPWA